MQDGSNLPNGEPQISSILHVNTDQSGGLPGSISKYYGDMLHTPVMRFAPSRRVGADRLIRHRERHLWPLKQGAASRRAKGRVGVTPWPAPAKGIGQTPDILARGGVMEPAARTVASGPEGPMRAGRRGWAVSGHTPGGSGCAGIRSAPTGVGGPCARVPQAAQLGAAWRVFGLAPWYMYRGAGHGEVLFGSPCHQASGLSSPVGQVAVARACALVDVWVLRLL